MKTFITSLVVSIVVGLFMLNAPAKWFNLHLSAPRSGTAFTTLAGTENLSAFPTTYDANLVLTANQTAANSFTALNTFTSASSSKFSAYQSSFGGTATSSFDTTGALTLITPLTVANGGTASTTLSSNQLLLGNGTSLVKTVSGWGGSGQFLTSNGAGVAPTWQSSSVDQTAAYNWTGLHSFSATTTMATSTAASSTATAMNVTNNLYAGTVSGAIGTWKQLAATTSAGAMLYATTTFTAVGDIHATIYAPSLGQEQLCMFLNADAGSNYANRAVTNFGVTGATGFGGLEVDYATKGFVMSANNNATTTDAYYTIDIKNIAASRKLVQWNGMMSASALKIPLMAQGSGVWNNTSAQITSLTFTAGSGSVCTPNNMPSGTIINVYGQ